MVMAAILETILGKTVGTNLYLAAKIWCAKFGYERPGSLEGVSAQTYTHAHTNARTHTHGQRNTHTHKQD